MPKTFITSEEICKLHQAAHSIAQLIPQYCPSAKTYLENDLRTFDEIIAALLAREKDASDSEDAAL
jgi:hypothetical protein